jgi:hypothetical protein
MKPRNCHRICNEYDCICSREEKTYQLPSIWKVFVVMAILIALAAVAFGQRKGYERGTADSVACKVMRVFEYKTGDSVFVEYRNLESGKIYWSTCYGCICDIPTQWKRGNIVLVSRKNFNNEHRNSYQR